MFTVVISEQIHLDGIKEYGTFLKPFLKDDKVAFCQWNPEGRTLQEAVPGLYPTVSRHDRWRMIVLCDEEGLDRKNPFDLVSCQDPVRGADMEDGAFFALRRQVRAAAYREAAKKPLVRLMTWMCRPPLVTDDVNNAQELDPEFAEYIKEAKERLAKILKVQEKEIFFTSYNEIYALQTSSNQYPIRKICALGYDDNRDITSLINNKCKNFIVSGSSKGYANVIDILSGKVLKTYYLGESIADIAIVDVK